MRGSPLTLRIKQRKGAVKSQAKFEPEGMWRIENGLLGSFPELSLQVL